MHRRLLLEIAAWLSIALAVYGLLYALTDTERFYLKAADSYQYLSMARNIRTGHGIATDYLHYGENHRTGLIPAPQTVFPPGYPILIAGPEMLGVDGVAAGLGVSLAAFALTLALTVYLGRLLDVRTGPLCCVLFLIVLNGAFWYYALRVYAESIFTAVSLLGLTLLVKAECLENRTWKRLGILTAGATAVGLAYWMRYAGCFLIASVVFYYGGCWLRVRSAARMKDLMVVSAVLAALILPIWIRNYSLTGSIQGGNSLSVNNSLKELGAQFATAWTQLMTGYLSEVTPSGLATKVNRGLLALAIVAFLFVAAYQLVRNRAAIFAGRRLGPLTLMATFVAVYILGLTYIAKYTMISYDDPRMYMPLMPVILLGIACLFPAANQGHQPEAPARYVVGPRWRFGLVSVLAVSYGVAQVYGLCSQGVGEHVKMQSWLADAMPAGANQQDSEHDGGPVGFKPIFRQTRSSSRRTARHADLFSSAQA